MQRTSEQDLQAFLGAYSPPVQTLALRVRALVCALVRGVTPPVIEQIDPSTRLIAYGFDRTYKGMLCVIMPLKATVNLGFPRGVDLPDPTRLLAGTGKHARHVKLAMVEQVDAPALRALLEAPLALARPRTAEP